MNDLTKINLHIHSNFSDGNNSIQQIVEKSNKLGLKFICLTDHFTNSWKSNIIPTLDSYEKINDYFEQIALCQQYMSKKGKDMVLLKGLEIDIQSSQKYILKYINPLKFDIILFEYLENPEGIAFIRNLLDYWKKKVKDENDLSIFGLAHFDPSFFLYGNLDILIKFLSKYKIYFEFNSSYPHCYSNKNRIFFDKLKNSKIPVAVGTDSHTLSNLGNIEEPLEMIHYYKLEDNLQILMKLLKVKKENKSTIQ